MIYISSKPKTKHNINIGIYVRGFVFSIVIQSFRVSTTSLIFNVIIKADKIQAIILVLIEITNPFMIILLLTKCIKCIKGTIAKDN